VIDHARLAAQLDVPLSIDEGRTLDPGPDPDRELSRRDDDLRQAGARGRLSNARALLARADELGLTAYLGGFFESPYLDAFIEPWHARA